MMRSKCCRVWNWFVALAALALASSAAAAETLYFTQVGSGVAGRLAFRTVFQITNENPEPALAALTFSSADGTSMSPRLESFWLNREGVMQNQGNRVDLTIPPASSLRLTIPPQAEPGVGWARLECGPGVTANALAQFAEWDSASSPAQFEEGLLDEVESLGVGGATVFSFPLVYRSAGRGIDTAFALANLSAVPATVALTRRPDQETSIQLAAGSVFAGYLSQIWPLQPGESSYDGLLEVRSPVPLGVLVYRTLEGLPLSGVIPASVPRAAEPGNSELGEEFSLALNQSATISSEGLLATFENVSEDSRCPSDVTCVWEGQAVVRVSLRQNGTLLGEADLTLRAGNQEMATGRLGAYRLRALRLDPYPSEAAGPIQPQDYRLTLVIARAE